MIKKKNVKGKLKVLMVGSLFFICVFKEETKGAGTTESEGWAYYCCVVRSGSFFVLSWFLIGR